MYCRKCGYDLMGYSECQNCGLLITDVYNDPPKVVKHHSVFSMCNRIMLTMRTDVDNVLTCRLTGDVCSSSNCPIKKFINGELTKIDNRIDVGDQLIKNMSCPTDEEKLKDSCDFIKWFKSDSWSI